MKQEKPFAFSLGKSAVIHSLSIISGSIFHSTKKSAHIQKEHKGNARVCVCMCMCVRALLQAVTAGTAWATLCMKKDIKSTSSKVNLILLQHLWNKKGKKSSCASGRCVWVKYLFARSAALMKSYFESLGVFKPLMFLRSWKRTKREWHWCKKKIRKWNQELLLDPKTLLPLTHPLEFTLLRHDRIGQRAHSAIYLAVFNSKRATGGVQLSQGVIAMTKDEINGLYCKTNIGLTHLH